MPSTTSSAPKCGKKDFTGIRQFNLMFKTYAGRERKRGERDLPAPRNRAGHLRQLRTTSCAPCARSSRRALRRLANPSATKLPPATSSSASANLSRWSWNSSASPATDLAVVRLLAFVLQATGCFRLGMKEEQPAPARPCSRRSLAFYSKATTDFEYPVPVRLG